MNKKVNLILLISLLIFSIILITAKENVKADFLGLEPQEEIELENIGSDFKQEYDKVKNSYVKTPLPDFLKPVMNQFFKITNEEPTLEQFVIYLMLLSVLFYTLFLILGLIPFLEKKWQQFLAATAMALIGWRGGSVNIAYSYIMSGVDVTTIFATRRFWVVIVIIILSIVGLNIFKNIIGHEKAKDEVLNAKLEGQRAKTMDIVNKNNIESAKDEIL